MLSLLLFIVDEIDVDVEFFSDIDAASVDRIDSYILFHRKRLLQVSWRLFADI